VIENGIKANDPGETKLQEWKMEMSGKTTIDEIAVAKKAGHDTTEKKQFLPRNAMLARYMLMLCCVRPTLRYKPESSIKMDIKLQFMAAYGL